MPRGGRSSSSHEWQSSARNGDAPRDIRPMGRTTARSRGNDARAKEGQRKQPGPATSTQDRFYRKGHAEAYNTEWKSPAEKRRHQRQGEGPCFSHHHSGAPWLGARKLDRDSRGCGFALHTITDNAPRARWWAGGCGTAAPGDMRGTPPYRHRPGRRAEQGRRGYTPQGGGGASAKRPKRRQHASVRGGQAFKRGRGHPDPPPLREAGASGTA